MQQVGAGSSDAAAGYAGAPDFGVQQTPAELGTTGAGEHAASQRLQATEGVPPQVPPEELLQSSQESQLPDSQEGLARAINNFKANYASAVHNKLKGARARGTSQVDLDRMKDDYEQREIAAVLKLQEDHQSQ